MWPFGKKEPKVISNTKPGVTTSYTYTERNRVPSDSQVTTRRLQTSSGFAPLFINDYIGAGKPLKEANKDEEYFKDTNIFMLYGHGEESIKDSEEKTILNKNQYFMIPGTCGSSLFASITEYLDFQLLGRVPIFKTKDEMSPINNIRTVSYNQFNQTIKASRSLGKFEKFLPGDSLPSLTISPLAVWEKPGNKLLIGISGLIRKSEFKTANNTEELNNFSKHDKESKYFKMIPYESKTITIQDYTYEESSLDNLLKDADKNQITQNLVNAIKECFSKSLLTYQDILLLVILNKVELLRNLSGEIIFNLFKGTKQMIEDLNIHLNEGKKSIEEILNTLSIIFNKIDKKETLSEKEKEIASNISDLLHVDSVKQIVNIYRTISINNLIRLGIPFEFFLHLIDDSANITGPYLVIAYLCRTVLGYTNIQKLRAQKKIGGRRSKRRRYTRKLKKRTYRTTRRDK